MLSIVLNEHDNVKHTAQYIIDIYDKRSKLLHNVPNVNQNRTDLYHINPQNSGIVQYGRKHYCHF